MSNDKNEILQKFPARKTQIRTLWNVIPDKNDSHLLSPTFQIIGASGTGKTDILCHILKAKDISYILINCYECYSIDVFYSKLLCEIFDQKEEYFQRPLNSFYDFLTTFQLAIREFGGVRDNLSYIIFKHSEFLDDSMFNNILYLEEEASFRTIWKFRSLFLLESKFRHRGRHFFTIFFPTYNKDELSEIILSKRPEYPRELFRLFLKQLLGVVFQVDRNLLYIIQLSDYLFPIFKKPVDEGRCSAENVMALYKHIEPYFKNDTGCTFSLNSRLNSKHSSNPEEAEKLYKQLDLPYYTKYLLLASYLASYIPPKLDEQFFSKSSKKKKKSKKMASRIHKVNYLTGPKSFPLNRLLAIYFAVVEEKSNISANLLSQVGSLLELRLITNSNKADNLNKPQYKCIAKPELIFDLAGSLKFDIHKFLPSE